MDELPAARSANLSDKMPETANTESEEDRVSRLKAQIKFPPVAPANNLRKDIFNPQKFKHIDKKAREAPQEFVKSYDALIHYLTDGLETDLERLRSIYMWMGTHPVSEQDYSIGDIDTNTPLGFMKRMKDVNGYFSAFFARLCWEARIPCEIVTGVAKSSTYEVGMEKTRLKTMKSTWNSVYVAGGWRLVFPLWSFSSVTEACKGSLTLVEDAGQAVRKEEVASEGSKITQLNEYYFLTNPVEFIHVAYPDDEKWQLISKPWTFEKFAEIPYCKEEYHRQEINIKSGFCGILTSKGGECDVIVQGKKDTYFTYKLSFNYTESGKKISDDLQLTKYVVVMRESDCWHVQIRFAETGVYKLEILGGGKESTHQSLCEFKITCTEVKENCRPVPLNPEIGFGPCIDTERAGLKALFKIGAKVDERRQNVEVRLRNIDYSCAELQTYINQIISKNGVKFKVSVPKGGEYALQTNTKNDEDEFASDEFENACNYLLSNDKEEIAVKDELPAARSADLSDKMPETANDENEADRDELPAARSGDLSDEMPETANEESEEDRVSRLKAEIKFPAVRPANNLRKDIFNPQKFKHIDKKAREAPPEFLKSYDALIHYLTNGLETDLERLRSIYMWMGTHPVSEQDYSMGDIDTNTPLGFMKRMKDMNGEARIPCEIVTGVAKSIKYEVGMEKTQLKTMRNSWNSVYVAGGWRLVFPLWSFSAVTGACKGNLTLVEDAGKAVRKEEVASDGYQITQLNEYYFLTNPVEFIHMAYPDDEKWQLISQPWTFEKFAEIPYCEEDYHRQEINIKSGFCGILTSKGGECDVIVQGKKDTYFTYKLYFKHTESGKNISDDLQLTRYVVVMRESDCWHFQIRFAETGVYKLEILGGGKGSAHQSLCEFKMTCTDVKENCRPVPLNPEIGFGPCIDTERAGLKAVSHISAKVDVRCLKETVVSFHFLKQVMVEARLHNIDYTCAELQTYIDQTISKNGVKFKVSVPKGGEYALQINTKDDEDELASDEFENACNYLLSNDKEEHAVKEVKKHVSAWKTSTQEVLRMEQKQIVQIRSVRNPENVLNDIMMATFLLLGEWEARVKDWDYVRKLLEKSGNESVKSRISSFTIKTLRKNICKAVAALTKHHTVENARMIRHGAGTFCDWVQKAVAAKETVDTYQSYLQEGTDYESDVFLSSDEVL